MLSCTLANEKHTVFSVERMIQDTECTKFSTLFITLNDEVTPGQSFNPLLISFIKSVPISDEDKEKQMS